MSKFINEKKGESKFWLDYYLFYFLKKFIKHERPWYVLVTGSSSAWTASRRVALLQARGCAHNQAIASPSYLVQDKEDVEKEILGGTVRLGLKVLGSYTFKPGNQGNTLRLFCDRLRFINHDSENETEVVTMAGDHSTVCKAYYY